MVAHPVVRCFSQRRLIRVSDGSGQGPMHVGWTDRLQLSLSLCKKHRLLSDTPDRLTTGLGLRLDTGERVRAYVVLLRHASLFSIHALQTNIITTTTTTTTTLITIVLVVIIISSSSNSSSSIN